MSVIFQVRKAIQEVKTDKGLSYLNLEVYANEDATKAYKEARKHSKDSTLPVFVIRVQKDKMRVYIDGKIKD